MDEAKINAQGITPIQDRLDAIAKLDGSEAIAEYLRTRAARGENFLFGFGAEADFKDSALNMAYAMQGGLGLPDKGCYFDADKQDTDRKSVVSGQSVSVRVDLGGRRIIKQPRSTARNSP